MLGLKPKIKLVLGIESSCDETAVSVLELPRTIRSSLVASQDFVHAEYGGVVPELASRKHIEMIAPLVTEALKRANISLNEIDGVAVTRAPGLIGSLLVGISFAKAVAYAHQKPLIGVNHLEGHLNAAAIEYPKIPYPYVGLVISGGHTSLYLVKKFGNYKLLGATRDDAAGEAFDKVAKLLRLGYPGGPIIDKLAEAGDPKAFKFTRPKMSIGSAFDIGELDFSFSGLKTAVMLEHKKMKGKMDDSMVANIASSFQHTVIEIVCSQVLKACKMCKCKTVVVSGGVAANNGLRKGLERISKGNNLKLFIPSAKFCTDNAVMIAYVGGQKLKMGKRDDFTFRAIANEELGI